MNQTWEKRSWIGLIGLLLSGRVKYPLAVQILSVGMNCPYCTTYLIFSEINEKGVLPRHITMCVTWCCLMYSLGPWVVAHFLKTAIFITNYSKVKGRIAWYVPPLGANKANVSTELILLVHFNTPVYANLYSQGTACGYTGASLPPTQTGADATK